MTPAARALAVVLSLAGAAADSGSPVPPFKRPPAQEAPAPRAVLPPAAAVAYEAGAAEARRTGRPLLTWVGQPAGPSAPSALVAAAARLDGFPATGVVLSAWVGGRHVGVPVTPEVAADPVQLRKALDTLTGAYPAGR